MISISRSALWALMAFVAMVLALAFPTAGLSLDISHSTPQIFLFVTAALLASYYPVASSLWIKRLIDLVENLALFSMIALLGALATYVVAKSSVAYYGPELAAFDKALGYDWARDYHYIAEHSNVAKASKFAYLSIFFTPTILITALVMTGQAQRVRTFLFAFALALALTIAIFAFFPAQSALGYYIGSESAYLPISGMTQDSVIAALRSGALSRVDPDALVGLVNFPSFHAQAGILFIWAGWSLRLLLYPMTLLNLALIAATPIEGSHYIADVVAGVALALMVIGTMYLPGLLSRKAFSPSSDSGLLATA